MVMVMVMDGSGFRLPTSDQSSLNRPGRAASSCPWAPMDNGQSNRHCVTQRANRGQTLTNTANAKSSNMNYMNCGLAGMT